MFSCIFVLIFIFNKFMTIYLFILKNIKHILYLMFIRSQQNLFQCAFPPVALKCLKWICHMMHAAPHINSWYFSIYLFIVVWDMRE